MRHHGSLKSGLAVLRETEFAMWLPKFGGHRPRAESLAKATASTLLPRRVRYDETSVRRVSALIQLRYSALPHGICVAVISGVS